MSDETITREHLLFLYGESGGPEAAALVTQVLAGLGWGEKQQFSRADVLAIGQGIAGFAREAVGRAPVSEQVRGHLDGVLEALEAHAFPLLGARP